MLTYSNNGRLVQQVSELPDLRRAKRLYLDCETTSMDPRLTSLNPWHHCALAGICVTADNQPGAWYVPFGHRRGNLPRNAVLTWLHETLQSCETWVNHNIKYDAHVCKNYSVGFKNAELFDTLTISKLIDSDRTVGKGYSLSALSKDWLGEDISGLQNRVRDWLKAAESKDYGDVPPDILAEYGCQDVITVRKLDKHISSVLPEQCKKVAATETKLTSVLFDLEQIGMRSKPELIKIETLKCLSKMVQIEERLHDLTGMAIRPHTNADCFELLCGAHGLPVLGWTDKGAPSFDKATFVSYAGHSDVLSSEILPEILRLIVQYRKLHTFHGLFLEPCSQLILDGRLYPTYNQSVRTGRMSCSEPNAQQFSRDAKRLVLPNKGKALLNADHSQAEFRIIVHYLKNENLIEAYRKNPDTDFHQWVADKCGISRDPAKGVNFGMGYGAGKPRILAMLAANPELAASVKADGRPFGVVCAERAERVYREYHATLPELRRVSWAVAKTLEARGYVFNLYGRRRHMPRQASYRAFNSLIQSTAADMIKEAMVRTSPRFNEKLRALGAVQIATVHDNILFEHDPDDMDRLVKIVKTEMETPGVDLRVPMKIDVSSSQESWGACK